MMRLALYTNVVSPHQLPLAQECVKRLGLENFRYVYTDCRDVDHSALNFKLADESWIIHSAGVAGQGREWIETADILLCGLRDFDLFERRARKGLKSFYMSERWFKPPVGYLRLMHPRYFGYAKRLVNLAKTDSLKILPIGVHARHDFARVGVPESAMVTWGYFVAPSSNHSNTSNPLSGTLRVLWVGRMLKLKKVDTIIKAVRLCGKKVALTIVGDGAEKDRLVEVSRGLENVSFLPPVGLSEVRRLMRAHDVYVLSSNGYEGWGAVVSEALEEGMIVFGTNQAGASATLLPEGQRFNCGDERRLAELLRAAVENRVNAPSGQPWVRSIGNWSAEKAAERLVAL